MQGQGGLCAQGLQRRWGKSGEIFPRAERGEGLVLKCSSDRGLAVHICAAAFKGSGHADVSIHTCLPQHQTPADCQAWGLMRV